MSLLHLDRKCRKGQSEKLKFGKDLEKGALATMEKFGMAIHSLFFPGEFHEQKSLTGYSSWGHKESDTTE